MPNLSTSLSGPYKQFVESCGVWEEAAPYIERFLDKDEVQLVLATCCDPATVAEVASSLGCSPTEAGARLENAYRRHLVDRDAQQPIARYSPAAFESLLDHFAKHDQRWDTIPLADRLKIDQRYFEIFVNKHRNSVLSKMQGLPVEEPLPNDDVLLLEEVLDMIEGSEVFAVQPCDCRRLGQRCQRSVEVCLALNDAARQLIDRDGLLPLTKSQAKEVIGFANKKGLMHTGDANWRENGAYYVCNCCRCDCYPFRAGHLLGSKGVWPRNRYVAIHDSRRCTACGICVKRCYFDAFERDRQETIELKIKGRHKIRKKIVFHKDSCWGCGLCRDSCPDEAISMKPV